MYNRYWSSREAMVVCRQLGYPWECEFNCEDHNYNNIVIFICRGDR